MPVQYEKLETYLSILPGGKEGKGESWLFFQLCNSPLLVPFTFSRLNLSIEELHQNKQ